MADDEAPNAQAIVAVLLDRHGRTFGEDLCLDLGRNTSSVLFQWFCAALLASARISSTIAMQAAAALAAKGWTTPAKLAESAWSDRVAALGEAGYGRFDEKTATMLGEAAELLIEAYGGDLRRLRSRADRKPAAERRLLKDFKGIGDVGVDIFFREAQAAWDELYPFADRKAREAAAALGLPEDAAALAALVDRATFPRLVAALVRAGRAGDLEEIRQAAC